MMKKANKTWVIGRRGVISCLFVHYVHVFTNKQVIGGRKFFRLRYTAVANGLHGYTRVYKGMQGYTRVYKGIKRYNRLHKGYSRV